MASVLINTGHGGNLLEPVMFWFRLITFIFSASQGIPEIEGYIFHLVRRAVGFGVMSSLP